jgi:Ni,Fe-hydrogenase III large subunit
VSRAGWTVEPAARFERTADRALAYVAPDGTFALYNDYARRGSVLVAAPSPPVPEEVVAAWRGQLDGPVPRRLAPHEAVEGYGTFTFPYGPISMGVPESGRFDVVTYGERVLELSPLGGYKTRHVLEGLAGARVEDAALRIERWAGNVSASHVAAFLAAAESAAGTTVPRPELWVRALAQELQRVYNHLHVLARIAEAASQNVGAAQSHALAEEVLRLQGRAFGHRWLFGALLPGGPPRRLDAADRRLLGELLRGCAKEFDALWELFLDSRTFVDRIQSTCPVSREVAIRWGGVGPTLRACGVPWDDRLRVPTPPYTDLFLALPEERDGDALARLLCRVQEVRASLLLIEQMLDRWPASLGAPEPAPPPVGPGRGLGRVEAPSGDLVYDVTLTAGRVAAVSARTPSQANWPLFAFGMRDAVFTDFHFALESFGLVFAETDR